MRILTIRNVVYAGVLISLLGVGFSKADARPQARLVPEKNRVEIGLNNGMPSAIRKLPLYEQRQIQYFSAGVGLEEREAQYPRFSLKCVFVGGAKTFLARVAVTVRDEQGGEVLQIPGEQVNGPWLFINLPKGKYVVTATRSDGFEVQRKISIGENSSTRVHFHWPAS